MRTYTILTLASALLVSASAFSQAPEGARLRPPAGPTLTMQSGKDQRFETIFFSPNGKRLAGVTVAGHHGQPAIYLWDAATGKRLFTRSWHKNVALSVRFNDDGTLLVASAPLPFEKAGEVQLWDPVTGKSLRTLNGADAGPVIFSPDGKLVTATGGMPASLGLWDVSTGKKVRALEGNADPIKFSPDSKLLTGIDSGGRGHVWNAATGKLIQTLEGAFAGGDAFSPDSKRVAGGTGLLGIDVCVWDVASGRKLLELRDAHVKRVVNVAFSPDGKRLVTGGDRRHKPFLELFPVERDGEVKIWDATTGIELVAFRVTDLGGLGSMCLAPDGKRVAVSPASGGQVTIWTLPSAVPEEPKKPPVPKASRDTAADDPHDAEIARLVKQLGSSDFRTREAATKRLKEIGEPALDALAKATTPLETRRRTEQIIAAIEAKLYPEFCLPGHANSVSVSTDGKRLLTIDNKAVRLWDAYTGKVLRVFEVHTDFLVNDAVLSPDGTRVLSASGFHSIGELQPRGDHCARLWDAQTGKELCKYEGHAGVVSSVAFGPEGQAISGGSGCMHLWDLKTGKTIRIFVCHEYPDATAKEARGLPVRVAYNAKAKLAATCGVFVHIRLWNLETGKEVRRFVQRELAYVCFSPDGKRLAGGFNHKGFLGLRIWDVGSGGELRSEPVARPEWPIFVAFSTDGKRIVTCNSDRTMRILDATSGRELYKSEAHADYVLSATFFPDGKRIASLISDYRGDTTVRIWRAPR